ncbi:PREDICTED: RNA polymerase-associated protein RTF1 homolog [Drosophila arizonae]|uniref:RNA polymerase-associated protein RTF1 homolog n=1 Tax=Drosophila arizonae TaxID=7263 RepID=A0ABM1NQ25_DROAR|nr:PREDICTED: RNA polymerase-associated protein RTF1 homolog [Drosophila arizonae]
MLSLQTRKRHLSFTEDLDEDELLNTNASDAADRARLQRETKLFKRSLKREKLLYQWGIKCVMLHKDKTDNAEHSTCVDYGYKHITADDREQDQEREQVVEQQPHLKQQLQQEAKLLFQMLDQRDQAKDDPVKPREVYSDESNASSDDEGYMDASHASSEPETFVSSLAELSKALLTRNQLESLLDKPSFEQTLIGCFVRISLSGIPTNQPTVYRLSRIVAVEHTDQEYVLGNHRTKVKLQLKHGRHLRSFQMDGISNQPVLDNEFLLWLDACQRAAQPLPSVNSINRKEKDIERALNYCFTEADAELMVQTKRRVGQQLVGAAYRKVCLIMEEVNKLEKLIKQIDEQSPIEHQRDKRRQYMSLAAPVPVRISSLEPVSRTKPTTKFDCQQYIRCRYKRFAHLNKLQLMQQMRKPIEDATSAAAPSTDLEQLNVITENISKEKLDMYELHNFEVNLDVSSLMPFSDICAEIEGVASEPIVLWTKTRTCTRN